MLTAISSLSSLSSGDYPHDDIYDRAVAVWVWARVMIHAASMATMLLGCTALEDLGSHPCGKLHMNGEKRYLYGLVGPGNIILWAKIGL